MEPTLRIIDPRSLKDIAWQDFSACAAREKNQVIITMMLDEIYRYLTNPAWWAIDGLAGSSEAGVAGSNLPGT